MSTIKDIFIIHQKGLEPLGFLAAEAINELMDCFPEYKSYFPVTNLGNWKSEDCYVWQNGKFELAPYMSVDWFLELGQKQAIQDGRWQEERKIDVDSIAANLCNKTSWVIFITKENLYQSTNGQDTIGKGCSNGACVLSIHHLLNQRNQLDSEIFKTAVQHEFGHILELTTPNRINTHMHSGYHCLCPYCIMQQQTATNNLEDMTENRLFCKTHGQPQICPDCMTQGHKNLFKIYAEYERNSGPNATLINRGKHSFHIRKEPPTHT